MGCDMGYLVSTHLLIPLIVEIPGGNKLREFWMLPPAPEVGTVSLEHCHMPVHGNVHSVHGG